MFVKRGGFSYMNWNIVAWRSVRTVVAVMVIALGFAGAVMGQPNSANMIFSPDANSTMGIYTSSPVNGSPGSAPPGTTMVGSTSKPLLTRPWIYVIFWGNYWLTNPKIFPSSYMNVFSKLVNSEFLNQLSQYGYNGASFSPTNYVVDSDPVPAGYSRTTAQNEVETLITPTKSFPHGQLPAPPAGCQSLYVILPDPTVSNTAGAPGWHSPVPIPVASSAIAPANAQVRVTAVAVLVARIGQAFSHEVEEAITDPISNYPNQINWQASSGGLNGQEIGDLGDYSWDLWNGIWVQAYWSQALKGVVVPYGQQASSAGAAMTSYFDGNLPNLFYLQKNGDIEHMFWTGARWATEDLNVLTGTTANANVPNGPSTFGMTSLASFFDGVSGHVFYVATDRHIHEMYQVNGTWKSGDDMAAYPALAVSGFSLSASFDSKLNVRHVYFLNEDGFPSEMVLNANNSSPSVATPAFNSWTEITAPFPKQSQQSQITSMFDGSSTHLFYIDYNGHINEQVDSMVQETVNNGTVPIPVYNLSSGAPTDWTAEANAQSSAPIMDSLTCPYNGGVFYFGPNAIYQLWINNGQKVITNMTALSGDKGLHTTTGQLTSYTDNLDIVHMLYIGADAHIHEEYLESGAWSADDPTAISGAANALISRQLTSVYDPVHGFAHVYYIANDQGSLNVGDVQELTKPDYSNWVQDLATGSSESNGPPATP